MTARDDYPELIHWIRGTKYGNTDNAKIAAYRALDEIDELRTEIARLRELVPATQGTSLSYWPDGTPRQ